MCEGVDCITDGLEIRAFELALLPRCRVTFCKGAIANRWCPARLGSVFLPKIRFQHPPPCPAHHAGVAFFTLFFPHVASTAFGRFSGFAGFGGACLCVFRTGHASYVGSCLLQSRKTERTPQRNQAFRIASMLFSGCAAEKCVKESTASQTVLRFAPSNWRFCLDAE